MKTKTNRVKKFEKFGWKVRKIKSYKRACRLENQLQQTYNNVDMYMLPNAKYIYVLYANPIE